MRRIIATTREPVYTAQGQLQGYLVHTDSVEDTATSPRRLHTQSAPACAHCHQAPTACRCLTTPPRAQAQDDEDGWMPTTILNARATETQPAVMSAETRAMRTAQADWWNLYAACVSSPNCSVLDSQLKACSTPHLTALWRELQTGRVVKEWRDEAMEAWAPQGLLQKYPRQP